MENTAKIEETRQTTPLRSVPERNPMTVLKKFLPFILIIAIIGLGIYSGLILHSLKKSKSAQSASATDTSDTTPKQAQALAQTFKDQADGVIQKNDVLDKYAQGTHRLIRPGGDSQTAYLTSSVLDLDAYVGKKVKVYGETFGSSQVGWLMDVGKVEVQN